MKANVIRKHKNLDTRKRTSQVLRATQKFENNHILLEPLQEDTALTEAHGREKDLSTIRLESEAHHVAPQ